jgi:hypothetical protein
MAKAKAAPLFGTPAPEPEAAPVKVEAARPAYREGKKAFSTWLNEKAIRQLKALAAEEGRTVQDLMVELINREFARKGKPEIA